MRYSRILFIALTLTIMAACAKDDPCEETVCYNNAPCISGTCECPEGYTGDDCSTEQTPSKVMLSKIIIVRFPAFKGNDPWDATGGSAPDLSFDILRGGSTVFSSPRPVKEDAETLEEYPFDFNPALELDPTSAHTIRLYDFDGAAGSGVEELMGTVDLIPYEAGNNFKEEVEVANGDTKFELHYTYVFE